LTQIFNKIAPVIQMQIVGILNLTPDSFSDGGQNVEIALQNLLPYSDIIDVGAESTKPNATPITADEEICRLKYYLPLVDKIKVKSIDTYHVETAEFALRHNFQIINCVKSDSLEDIFKVAGSSPVIATFDKPFAPAVLKRFFENLIHLHQNIILDPGIGFNKSRAMDIAAMRCLPELCNFGKPVMIGLSRKRLVGYLTGKDISQRDLASCSLSLYCAAQGVQYLRVHNARLMAQLLEPVRALSTAVV